MLKWVVILLLALWVALSILDPAVIIWITNAIASFARSVAHLPAPPTGPFK